LSVDEPELKPLAVDLDMLSSFLEGDPLSEQHGRLNLRTGEIWSLLYGENLADEENAEDDEADNEWVGIDQLGSRQAYRDMVLFSETVSERGLSRLLEVALAGRGAFRRFKDVLAEYPEERERWFNYANERRFRRAEDWLAELGYQAVTPDNA
jgi:hypothetical protein